MRVVVADTGPLRYLVLIDMVDLLPRLFETIIVPSAVRSELDNAETPAFDRLNATNFRYRPDLLESLRRQFRPPP